ncbi:hypothetical protein MGG_17011 [Pyricularia oryzae 70-15]|uniref:Uncharacterized protein n=2 Tax=Pyricularia oryzae TaxID=318829 RepID=G4NA55_PYRO7|nr:uncharacterized protein MGG_17011 [Pyricularia oryzae 70-15]EHA49605.1 hypothetical protein MGG_17011 [Pyricularia oryzae 70-15]ELQ42239.1 hypothetical protein OOU_Y34scaffold00222g15 [Pyricularia oryzae Y34]
MAISRHGPKRDRFPISHAVVCQLHGPFECAVAPRKCQLDRLNTPGAPSPKVPDGAESRPPVVGQSAGGLWNHSDDCREKRKMGPKLLA